MSVLKNERIQSSKVGYILAYKDPEYIRTRTLIAGLQNIANVNLYLAVNTQRSFLRYPQTLLRLVMLRLRHNPDSYVLGFRGVEIYWLVRFITLGKPLVYDEFLDPYVWIFHDHKKVPEASLVGRFIQKYLSLIAKNADMILADTSTHAAFSAGNKGVPVSKYLAIPVGADDSVFSPRKDHELKSKTFTVLFYGSMLPLHGLEILLEAAKKFDKNITLEIIGGKKDTEEMVRKAADDSACTITYTRWVDIEELPNRIAQADICLGGPFGATKQSELVITGKTYQFLAMKKPVIVGDNSAHLELFRDKDNCLIVKRGDALSIVKAVDWAYQHKDRLPHIASAGRALYENEFSQDVISTMLTSIVDVSSD